MTGRRATGWERFRAQWSRPLVRRVILVGAAGFGIGYLITALLFFSGGPRADIVTVPDVRALTVPAARRVLSESDLLVQVMDSLPNPRIERGGVVAQTPLPGQEVPPETQVQVIISLGPQQTVIPRVDSYPGSQAERILTATGFQVEIQNIPDLRSSGLVVGTVPGAGTSVPMPATVRLLISSGPPLVAIPSVVGMLDGEARNSITSLGLRVGDILRIYQPEMARSVVLAQRPVAGDTVRAGRSIDLWVVSHEPDPEPLPQPAPELPPDSAAPAPPDSEPAAESAPA